MSSRPLDPKVSRHIGGLWPDLTELFDVGEAVEGLLAHPGWQHVARLVEAEIETIEARLDGAAEPLSQAEYAMAHGRRGGLRYFEHAANGIITRAQDRLAEQRAKHERAGESAQEA